MTPEEIQTLKSLNLAYKKILTEYFKTPDQFKAIILLLKAMRDIVLIRESITQPQMRILSSISNPDLYIQLTQKVEEIINDQELKAVKKQFADQRVIQVDALYDGITHCYESGFFNTQLPAHKMIYQITFYDGTQMSWNSLNPKDIKTVKKHFHAKIHDRRCTLL